MAGESPTKRGSMGGRGFQGSKSPVRKDNGVSGGRNSQNG
jgi:hypothetical protein